MSIQKNYVFRCVLISFASACQPYSLEQLYPEAPEVEVDDANCGSEYSTCETTVENVINIPESNAPIVNNNIEIPATPVEVSCPNPIVEVEAPVTPVINVPAPVVNVEVSAPNGNSTATPLPSPTDVVYVKVQTEFDVGFFPTEGGIYALGSTSGIIENGIYTRGKPCAVAICNDPHPPGHTYAGTCRGKSWSDGFTWDLTACCPNGYRPVSIMQVGPDEYGSKPALENLVCHRR